MIGGTRARSVGMDGSRAQIVWSDGEVVIPSSGPMASPVSVVPSVVRLDLTTARPYTHHLHLLAQRLGGPFRSAMNFVTRSRKPSTLTFRPPRSRISPNDGSPGMQPGARGPRCSDRAAGRRPGEVQADANTMTTSSSASASVRRYRTTAESTGSGQPARFEPVANHVVQPI